MNTEYSAWDILKALCLLVVITIVAIGWSVIMVFGIIITALVELRTNKRLERP